MVALSTYLFSLTVFLLNHTNYDLTFLIVPSLWLTHFTQSFLCIKWLNITTFSTPSMDSLILAFDITFFKILQSFYSLPWTPSWVLRTSWPLCPGPFDEVWDGPCSYSIQYTSSTDPEGSSPPWRLCSGSAAGRTHHVNRYTCTFQYSLLTKTLISPKFSYLWQKIRFSLIFIYRNTSLKFFYTSLSPYKCDWQ